MSGEEIFLIWSLCIYIGTCLIWLIASYIYCHTHYNEFTLKEMIGFGDSWYADENAIMFFFPYYNTLALLFMGIVSLCRFIGYLFDKIGRIKLK
jgi:hypothetical protein